MELYCLRHGIAAEREAAGVKNDSKRPLTAQGCEEISQIAKSLKLRGHSFDLILSSPYVRAKETAEIIAKTLGIEKNLKYSDTLACSASPEELIREINQKYRKMNRILLVGHEPYLSRLMSILISGTQDVFLALAKGGMGKLLVVESLSYGKCAELEWLVAPEQINALLLS